MIEELNVTAKQVGGELISGSALLDAKMEKWSDSLERPGGMSTEECVGFISKESESILNFVIDVQVPISKNDAILRTWCIQSEIDENHNERYNNIQLDFAVDYAQAHELAQKGAEVTRDDIHSLLNERNTHLAHMVVSNQAGYDKASEHTLGERYEIAINDPGDQNETDRIENALHAVLAKLKTNIR